MFGAFVRGSSAPDAALRKETVAKLESVTFGVLALIFFGIVGLRVTWSLGGGQMLGVVIRSPASASWSAARWARLGGMRFWEARRSRSR